jgi:hypothetical protein
MATCSPSAEEALRSSDCGRLKASAIDSPLADPNRAHTNLDGSVRWRLG